MKIILIMISLALTIPAHAGLGWLLLAAAASGSKQAEVKPDKTDLQLQVDSINSTLPSLCTGSNKYSGCWSQHSQKSKLYSVSPNQASELESFYRNLGYNVGSSNNQLVFNFEKEYDNFLFVESLFITGETLIVLVFLSIFPIGYLILRARYQRRVAEISSAYQNSKDKLMFWEKGAKEKLEECLNRKTLPSSWSFNIKNNQIQGITFYNGRSIGRIASCRDGLYESLKVLGLINMEERIKAVKEKIAREKKVALGVKE